MNKLLLITIIGILLVGTIFVTAKLIDEKKIKDIKKIDCNKKLEPSCKNKIKIEDNNPLKINLIEDNNAGRELYKVYSE